MKHIRQSLSWKLSLGIVLMAIPIFALSLHILYYQSRHNVKDVAMQHASSELSTTMLKLVRTMEIVETATDASEKDVTDHLMPDSLLAYTRYIIDYNRLVDGCSVCTEPNVFPSYGRYFTAYTSREGDSVTSVIERDYDYFEKVWYKVARLKGDPCWVVYGEDGDSLAMPYDGMIASYCKPLHDANGHFVGVIASDMSLERLSKTITSESSFEDSYFMMTGDKGRYLLHPDSTQQFKKTIFSDVDPRQNADIIALGHEMTTGQQGHMTVRINGEPCLVSYQPVPGTNWSLALACPERSVLKGYNRLSYIVGPLIVIGLLMILLFSSVTIAHAIQPLYKLSGKLQRISEGHYDERIATTSNHDIVGRMQNSFAMMQESLFHHVNDIQKINSETALRNEELVRIGELAKESDRQKSLFIQNVSHQIRTPLNIIMGFAQVLKDGRSTLQEDEMRSITEMMWHNAQILDRMVQMLFDSSARGATEELYASKSEEVSCNEVARECLASVHNFFPHILIGFTSELQDDFCIHTNYLYLMHSIRELLYNACKFSDGEHVSLRIRETDSKVCFVVEDTGPGIADEDCSSLFEMFTKVNDLSEGLGLGLALTRRHVQNLGGNLFLDTIYKAGCRFVIELPIAS